MAELFRSWAKVNPVEFHYLSSSSYWLYPTMLDFLRDQKFPPGTMHFRASKESGVKGILSLFESDPKEKSAAISRLVESLPHRRYVLIGDSGEHDPEVYGELARNYPSQIRRILIHNIGCDK